MGIYLILGQMDQRWVFSPYLITTLLPPDLSFSINCDWQEPMKPKVSGQEYGVSKGWNSNTAVETAHLVSLWSQPKPFVSRPRRSWQHCSPPWPTLPHCFPQFHPIHLLSSVLDMAYMPLELFRTVPGISSPDPWPYVINRIIKIKEVCSNISEEAFS